MKSGTSIIVGGRGAVIFDMDGVIVDSAACHYLSWCQMLKRREREYSYGEFTTNFGRRTDMQVRRIFGNMTDEEVAAFAWEKDSLFRENVAKHISAFPGVIELIRSLKSNGSKIALGSSAVIENIRLIVDKLGVKNGFDSIVSGDEVTEGKPSPQIFLLAAKKLGVDPAKCVVIEDAVVGVAAAKKGGMHTVAVTNTHPRDELKDADLIVDSLNELDASQLERPCFFDAPNF